MTARSLTPPAASASVTADTLRRANRYRLLLPGNIPDEATVALGSCSLVRTTELGTVYRFEDWFHWTDSAGKPRHSQAKVGYVDDEALHPEFRRQLLAIGFRGVA